MDILTDGTVFISIGGSFEFDVWLEGAPMIEPDQGGLGNERPPAQIF